VPGVIGGEKLAVRLPEKLARLTFGITLDESTIAPEPSHTSRGNANHIDKNANDHEHDVGRMLAFPTFDRVRCHQPPFVANLLALERTKYPSTNTLLCVLLRDKWLANIGQRKRELRKMTNNLLDTAKKSRIT
jgi:hypothetical protein